MSKNKTFIKLLLVQISFLSFSYLIFSEFLIRKYIVPYDNNIISANLFESSKTNMTIWGDSQLGQAINYLEDFNNFSIGGQTYEEIEIKLKK